jgi:hypothetical protein
MQANRIEHHNWTGAPQEQPFYKHNRQIAVPATWQLQLRTKNSMKG